MKKVAETPAPLKPFDDLLKEAGSQEAAARQIGISVTTLNRWVNKHARPDRLARRVLRAMGYDVPHPELG